MGSLAHLHDFRGLNHRIDVVEGVCAEEASERLRTFFKALRSGN